MVLRVPYLRIRVNGKEVEAGKDEMYVILKNAFETEEKFKALVKEAMEFFLEMPWVYKDIKKAEGSIRVYMAWEKDGWQKKYWDVKEVRDLVLRYMAYKVALEVV